MKNVAFLRTALIVASLGVLELLCRTGLIKAQTMIAPTEMVRAMVALLAAGTMRDDILRTLGCVVAAFVLAVIVGFAAGVVIHALPRLRRAVDPLLATWYAVPFFVFYPVLIAFFGLTPLPIIVIAFLFSAVAMVINTLNGLDRIARVLGKVARIYHMTPLQTALHLKLPAAAPHLFTGVKLAVAYSFIGVIASEFIMAASGLGYQISYAYNNFDNRRMYALMLFVLIVVTAVNMAFHVWERRLMHRRGL